VVLPAVRLVRDWSSSRRRGGAQARAAEAAAKDAEARAEFVCWLVEEAKSGRMLLPPGELLRNESLTGLPLGTGNDHGEPTSRE